MTSKLNGRIWSKLLRGMISHDAAEKLSTRVINYELRNKETVVHLDDLLRKTELRIWVKNLWPKIPAIK